MRTSVVNIHLNQTFDIYIGRQRGITARLGARTPGSLGYWGNDWTHLKNVPNTIHVPTRDIAVQMYRQWAENEYKSNPKFREEAAKLRGKRLGCFCRPADGFQSWILCHGQILAGLADGIPPEDVE